VFFDIKKKCRTKEVNANTQYQKRYGKKQTSCFNQITSDNKTVTKKLFF
jgi:hypothetical protein